MSSKAMADRVAVEAFPTDVTNNGVSLPLPLAGEARSRQRRRSGEGGSASKRQWSGEDGSQAAGGGAERVGAKPQAAARRGWERKRPVAERRGI